MFSIGIIVILADIFSSNIWISNVLLRAIFFTTSHVKGLHCCVVSDHRLLQQHRQPQVLLMIQSFSLTAGRPSGRNLESWECRGCLIYSIGVGYKIMFIWRNLYIENQLYRQSEVMIKNIARENQESRKNRWGSPVGSRPQPMQLLN